MRARSDIVVRCGSYKTVMMWGKTFTSRLTESKTHTRMQRPKSEVMHTHAHTRDDTEDFHLNKRWIHSATQFNLNRAQVRLKRREGRGKGLRLQTYQSQAIRCRSLHVAKTSNATDEQQRTHKLTQWLVTRSRIQSHVAPPGGAVALWRCGVGRQRFTGWSRECEGGTFYR